MFAAAAAARPLPEQPLRTLSNAVRAASAHLALSTDGLAATWHWTEESSLDRVGWIVARAAADLLTSPLVARVRVCAGVTCDWLFLDLSRNRSRRWCDMAVCGNRAKVRRFREAHPATL